MRVECIGHRNAAEITDELNEPLDGRHDMSDVCGPDPARHRRRGVLDADRVRRTEDWPAPQHGGSVPEQVGGALVRGRLVSRRWRLRFEVGVVRQAHPASVYS
ncbi:MAG TPA: hypothetical protein VE196_09740 [Pseudonocardiaceae bacterium]|nr:hypothetical protein [Pseudonocardiaceae bacterium]